MVIYILHEDKYNTFELPKVINGNYMLYDNYESQKRNLINIVSENNSWVACSNNDVKIFYNDMIVNKITLEVGKFYQLILYGRVSIPIFVAPSFDNSFKLYTMKEEKDSLTVGSDSSCDISFTSPFIDSNHFRLSFEDNSWSINVFSSRNTVYVNSVKILEGYLNNFDCIFILGLKIIVFGKYILCNMSNDNRVKLSPKLLSSPQLTYITGDLKTNGMIFNDFYDDKNYFESSPVFHDMVQEKEITIENPPSMNKTETSIMAEIIPSAAMLATSIVTLFYSVRQYRTGEMNQESYVTNLVMCGALFFTSILWPFLQGMYIKTKENITLKRIRRKYNKYLNMKKNTIEDIRVKEENSLRNNYVDLQKCILAIAKRNSTLFSRNIKQNDFLTFRLGIGNTKSKITFNYSRPEFLLENENIYDSIDKIINEERLVKNVPVLLSMKKYNVVSFINEDGNTYNYLFAMVMQAIALHNYDSLKIVIFTSEVGNSKLSFLKEINHIWDNSKDIRFYATSINEATDISKYLEGIYNTRKNPKNNDVNSETIDTYYLIITDNISMYRKINIIDMVLSQDQSKDFGFKLMIFAPKVNVVPSSCQYFINYSDKEAMGFETSISVESTSKFVPELSTSFSKNLSLGSATVALSNIPIKIANESSGNLTNNLGFLEMYGVGKVEQLNIEERWRKSDVINTLSVPVGIDSTGSLINLDLHEKRHGPHGLIAGTTGSGKSEFIITYILSLAINYNPEEVQFVLIDYKGGGLAGAFENKKFNIKLPHLVGTITNLDKSELNRTLVSIQSELNRRQLKFNEIKEKLNTGTIDIYKYQKLYRDGLIDEPMSHLFIISDEFAELKAQQPDFMDNLVSAARIGRSLGIHLILATQKPSGVVDDQIWSNSKFKVCCKVQTKEDSNEMLGKPDAASLKDSGRFYLQVGYDIYYILGQSAYSGRQYKPSDKLVSVVDNTISMVNNIGEVTNLFDAAEVTETQSNSENYGEELNNVLKQIITVFNKESYKIKNLWLNDIPNNLYLKDLIAKYSNFIKNQQFLINPVIGEYDDPSNQNQGIVTLPITLSGHCLIAGSSGSGKTTLLSTIIYQILTTHSPNEVNFYIVDYGSEQLKKFANFPQVGDVLTSENLEKIKILFKRTKNEIERRKEIFAGNYTNIIDYNLKNNVSLPNEIIIINGYDSFKEQFDDFTSEEFLPLLREGEKYGIYFIVSCLSLSSISYNLMEQFTNKIPLNLNDPEDYATLVNTKETLKDVPGRGFITIENKVYQFQCSLICDANNLNDYINETKKIICSKYENHAPKIPLMPEVIDDNSFNIQNISLNNMPIGIAIDSIEPVYYDFSKHVTFIMALKEQIITSFVQPLSKLFEKLNDSKIIVIDGNQKHKYLQNMEHIKYYDSNFVKLFEYLNNNKNSLDDVIIFVFGYGNIKKHIKEFNATNNSSSISLDDLIFNTINTKYRFIILDTRTDSDIFSSEKWFSYVSKKDGILLGINLEDQEFFRAISTGFEVRTELSYDNALVLTKGSKTIINYLNN